jgi:hypothetical protein
MKISFKVNRARTACIKRGEVRCIKRFVDRHCQVGQ